MLRAIGAHYVCLVLAALASLKWATPMCILCILLVVFLEFISCFVDLKLRELGLNSAIVYFVSSISTVTTILILLSDIFTEIAGEFLRRPGSWITVLKLNWC